MYGDIYLTFMVRVLNVSTFKWSESFWVASKDFFHVSYKKEV